MPFRAINNREYGISIVGFVIAVVFWNRDTSCWLLVKYMIYAPTAIDPLDYDKKTTLFMAWCKYISE